MPLPRKRLSGCACHSPLAHFYIHHSESSIREINPFTTITHLASKKILIQEGEEFISIQFLFRQSVPKSAPQTLSQPPMKKSTQWTNKLAALVDEEKADVSRHNSRASTQPRQIDPGLSETIVSSGVKTSLRLEGPYFTPANPEAYKTVVCLVAGTGLSGAIAIAAAFKAQASASIAGASCTMRAESGRRWERCFVIWTVREKDFVEMPFFDGTSIIKTRDWRDVLTETRSTMRRS